MNRRRLLLGVAALVAALGVAMVFVYAKGADSRAAEQFDTTDVLVANARIDPGESVDDALAAGKIELRPVTRSTLLEGATDSSEGFSGSVALTTLYPGEQLVPEKFGGADEVEAAATLPIPKGKVAMSVTLDDPARVGTFTRPGAEVSVFLTQEGVTSRLLLERVTVLASGSTTSLPSSGQAAEASEDTSDEEQALLTIAVSQKEAEKVLFGQSVGTLSVALLNDESDVSSDGGVGPADLFE